MGAKRARDWADAVQANQRAPMPRLQEPNDLPNATGFLCPITQCLMQDPVLCTLDQCTYERKAIEKALKASSCSPLNNARLQPKQPIESVLIPNQSIRDAITFWLPRMLASGAKGCPLV